VTGDLDLAAQLGAAVDGQGAGVVPLVVGPVLVPREDVVGGEVDEVGARPGGGHGQVAGTERIDRHGPLRIELTAVDVGPGGAADHRVGLQLAHHRTHRVATRHVEVGPRQGVDLMVGEARSQLAAHPTPGARHEDSHTGMLGQPIVAARSTVELKSRGVRADYACTNLLGSGPRVVITRSISVRAKIAGVVVAFAVLLGGGIFLAVDDEGPSGADVNSGGSVPEDCRAVDLVETKACY
jgi:hypothetical protein